MFAHTHKIFALYTGTHRPLLDIYIYIFIDGMYVYCWYTGCFGILPKEAWQMAFCHRKYPLGGVDA